MVKLFYPRAYPFSSVQTYCLAHYSSVKTDKWQPAAQPLFHCQRGETFRSVYVEARKGGLCCTLCCWCRMTPGAHGDTEASFVILWLRIGGREPKLVKCFRLRMYSAWPDTLYSPGLAALSEATLPRDMQNIFSLFDVSLFLLIGYSRLVLVSYESPFFRKSIKTPRSASFTS